MPPENGEKHVYTSPNIIYQQRTPPPDTFGHIQPCTHLKSVLETKAHDTVVETYRQAVAVLITVNPLLLKNLVYTLQKDNTEVPAKKVDMLKAAALRCSDCGVNNLRRALVCLQCPHVGCYGDHSQNHATQLKHTFAIDLHNGLLYCFSCGDYINHTELNEVRMAAVRLVSMIDGGSVETGSGKETAINPHPLPPSSLDGVYANFTNPTASAVSGLKGIVNLGSTCFMSSVLQTMLHNPLIQYQFFNNDLHQFHCELPAYYQKGDENIDERNACLTCAVDTIFSHFFTLSSHEGHGITNLLMTAWYKNKLLAGFEEQDAHEFWQFMLSEFHNDYERVAANASVPLEPCKCITHLTFQGQLESSIACVNCGVVTRTTDPLVDLSLEIPKPNSATSSKVTLYDCLDRFTHNEALDVKYRCRHCRTETNAHKSLRIKRIPHVLSVQLKRFKHGFNEGALKLESVVDLPLFLDLTRYTSDYSPDNDGVVDSNKVYELFALVCHIGLVNTGHYVAIIKKNGIWFRFDDSVISQVSVDEVRATSAYMLFYVAHNIETY